MAKFQEIMPIPRHDGEVKIERYIPGETPFHDRVRISFQNRTLRLRQKNKTTDMKELTIPARYLLRISQEAQLGRQMIKETGGSEEDDYCFSEGETVGYHTELLKELLVKKLHADSIEIIADR